MNDMPCIEKMFHLEDPCTSLRAFVIQMYKEGYTKQALYNLFYDVFLELRKEGREAEEDLILDCILDALCGWCASHYRLIPDEPDICDTSEH